jgi:calcineurin-like phosphoesterase family protein
MDERHWRIHGHIHNNGYYDGRSAADHRLVPFLKNHINLSCEMTKYQPVNLALLLDAVLLGRLPDGSTPGDDEAPSAADIGKENPHA